jgi:uncharacterized membrane protein (UPF0127 family)
MKHLAIEIADTSAKREYGLMNRKYLPKNQGMLFKFHNPTFASFWMKNTYIPLDIAFLDENGKVLQIESMSPLSTKTTYSNNRCKYALEVNKGWFCDNGVKIGSRIGGEGIKNQTKIAAASPLNSMPSSGAVPSMSEVIPGQPPASNSAPPSVNPDVQLNLTNKQKLENAELKGQKLTMICKNKEGLTMPPVTISPPFEFEKDEDGHHNKLFKAKSEQAGDWRSYLIDNIISLEVIKIDKGNSEEEKNKRDRLQTGGKNEESL